MREMPAADFTAWRAAYDFEPWGEERADLREAMQCAIADSARLKANAKPLKTYMPFYREPQIKRRAPPDPNAGRKIWAAVCSMWNNARERRKAAARPGRKKK
jgi:hypothetical protein